jgi:hypothetical protein
LAFREKRVGFSDFNFQFRFSSFESDFPFFCSLSLCDTQTSLVGADGPTAHVCCGCLPFYTTQTNINPIQLATQITFRDQPNQPNQTKLNQNPTNQPKPKRFRPARFHAAFAELSTAAVVPKQQRDHHALAHHHGARALLPQAGDPLLVPFSWLAVLFCFEQNPCILLVICAVA